MVEKKEFPIGTFKKKKNFYKCNGLLLVNNFKSKNFFIDFWKKKNWNKKNIAYN